MKNQAVATDILNLLQKNINVSLQDLATLAGYIEETPEGEPSLKYLELKSALIEVQDLIKTLRQTQTV